MDEQAVGWKGVALTLAYREAEHLRRVQGGCVQQKGQRDLLQQQ
jgi:hypothetical protein